MKQLNRLFRSVALTHERVAVVLGASVLAVVALSNSAVLTRAQEVAWSNPHSL